MKPKLLLNATEHSLARIVCSAVPGHINTSIRLLQKSSLALPPSCVETLHKANDLITGTDTEDMPAFTGVVKQVRTELRKVMGGVCMGLSGLQPIEIEIEQERQRFTTEFYKESLGMHTILEEFVAVRETGVGWVQEINISEMVERLAKQKRFSIEKRGESFNVVHVRPQLQNILRMLMENSKFSVTVVSGSEDVVVRIRNEDQGYNLKKMRTLWKWPWAKPPASDRTEGINSASKWHGFAAAHITLEYFGGQLLMVPVEGVGVDSFVYLPHFRTARPAVRSPQPLLPDTKSLWERIMSIW